MDTEEFSKPGRHVLKLRTNIKPSYEAYNCIK